MFEKLIAFQARYRPDAVAISTPVGNATFAALDADVNRMARRLSGRAKPGAKVVVQVAGSGLHWVVLLALARLGCISASLPPVGERPQTDLLNILAPDLLLTEKLIEGWDTLHVTPDWVAETFRMPPEPMAQHHFAASDPVRIVMSSGTTGRPKKMLMTRAMVDARVRTGGLSQMGHRRVHAAVGLDTETGFRAPLVAWASGSAAVYPEVGFQWADFLLGSQPQVLVMVPAQLDALLSSLPTGFVAPAELVVILISASPSQALFAKAKSRLTSSIYVVYGSTEAGLSAQASPGLLGSGETLTGVVSPSAEVEVVDGTDTLAPWGMPGRIRVRSEEMVTGYLDDPELTAQFFRDGWFYPGDLGALSAAGRLTLCGRESEVLELGGMRVAPEVIEDALLEFEGVCDAAAFSTPSPEGDVEQAWAAVVCAAGCDLGALGLHLRRALPQLNATLIRVGVIPRTGRGKIDRGALCAYAALSPHD